MWTCLMIYFLIKLVAFKPKVKTFGDYLKFYNFHLLQVRLLFEVNANTQSYFFETNFAQNVCCDYKDKRVIFNIYFILN